jgi:catechol 2,3-dioxygenase-like lactoylglutathione lyase family enzyme
MRHARSDPASAFDQVAYEVVYHAASASRVGRPCQGAGMTIRGRDRKGWLGIVLGAPSARELAYFYRDLLGWELATDEPDWCTIGMPESPVNLAFQTEANHVRPVWPGGPGDQQMQLHLDLQVTDLPGSVEDALALGATLPGFQPQEDVQVLLDPAGHPFCLYL